MIQCRVCQTRYVSNTIYCTECGTYLLGVVKPETDPLDVDQMPWRGDARTAGAQELDLPDTGPLSIRLVIGERARRRHLQVSLARPARLGRSDPSQDVFPEVDLTVDLALEFGVSREHTCIFGQGRTIMVEDLGSTNGTLLNGKRLDPYMPETLKHGDQLQLGKLLIDVRLI